MKKIFFFPVILLLLGGQEGSGHPQPQKKVTTFVTYAYEQGDEPIQVPVPSGGFNTPELASDPTGLGSESAEIENVSHEHEHPDLARDLLPPRESHPLLLRPPVPLTGPIPIPIEQPPSGPPSPGPAPLHPVKLEEFNLIHENEELKGNQVVETSDSITYPAKSQSFQIIKAPMIQEHSVTNDGDFMKALAHAFGVTNRFVLNSQLGRGLRAPEPITTVLPPIPAEQAVETVEVQQESVPSITENPFSAPQQLQQQQIEHQHQLMQQKQQSLQAALIQSLQRLNVPQSGPGSVELSLPPLPPRRENGVFQIYSHASSQQEQHEIEIPSLNQQSSSQQQQQQSQLPPPPPHYQYTLHVAEEAPKELTRPEAGGGSGVASKPVILQEAVKVLQQQGLYNTEVVTQQQQIEQPPPQQQYYHQQQQQLQLPPVPPQFRTGIHPTPVRKFKPIKPSHEVIEAPPTIQIGNSAEVPSPVVTPVKYTSDSTTVSKTTFTRFRPQVLLFRNGDRVEKAVQTTTQKIQTNPSQQYSQVQPTPTNQQIIQTTPVNQQYIQEGQQFAQEHPANQQFVQQTPANQQFVQENPTGQQYIQEGQQFIQGNSANQQYIQENPVNQQYTQENQQYTQENQAFEANGAQGTNTQQQIYNPANAISGEVQKQNPNQQQRFIYRYMTNGGAGASGEQVSQEGESQYDNSQEVEGKYAIFEPQKVVQRVNAAGEPIGVVVNRNQFRRRRPNGRRLKVRRKKVKVRRLAPTQVPVQSEY